MSESRSSVSRAAAVIGHELRNPLAAAITGAALACELVDADDPRHTVVSGVVGELQRMSQLLDSYLNFARCGEPRSDRIALKDLCDAVVQSRPGVSAVVAPEVMVRGDQILLSRVLENLVDNARQVGASTVRIRAHGGEAKVVISVEDDGPGVPTELRTKIFQPGVSRRGSTGLGLSIVAETVAAHGGQIRCEAVAQGARFVFELPVCAGVEQTNWDPGEGLRAGA